MLNLVSAPESLVMTPLAQVSRVPNMSFRAVTHATELFLLESQYSIYE